MSEPSFLPPEIEEQAGSGNFMLLYMSLATVTIVGGMLMEIFFSSYQCQRGDECWGGLEIILVPLFILFAYFIGRFIKNHITHNSARWMIAFVLFAGFIAAIDGQGFTSWYPESRIEKQFAEEVARLPQKTNIVECAPLARNFWRKGTPYDWHDYKPWKQCIQQTMLTTSDVVECQRQAGDIKFIDTTRLIDYCTSGN